MDDKKTIIIVNDFNYVQGGASKVAIQTAKILKENTNYRIIFFSAVNRPEENIEGIEYISTNQNEALKEKNKLKGIINGIYNFKAKKEFKKLLLTLDRKHTIIHVHGWTKALSSSIFDIAFKMKFKVVLTLHDYFTACPNGGYFNYKENEICHLKPLSWKCVKCNCDSRNYAFKIYRVIRQFVQNKIVKLNDKLEYVITISDFSEKILKQTLNPKTKITRIYNPIDIEPSKDQIDFTKNKYYLYVGRVAKEKGVDLFCQAITELNLEGIVVGDGSEKEKLEKEFPNIQFVGWKSSDGVKEYMKKARALVMPSRWYEAAPLTNIEALLLGVPSLVSKNCAASDVSNEKNKNGLTFECNVESLKKCIQDFESKKVININESKFKIIEGRKKYYTNLIKNYYNIVNS